MDCDYGLHNGPLERTIDTSDVIYLDTAKIVSITVVVTEWDKATLKRDWFLLVPVFILTIQTPLLLLAAQDMPMHCLPLILFLLSMVMK